VDGLSPELWLPDEGSIAPVKLYRSTGDHRTEIPLSFPAYGSAFIVFTHAPGRHLVGLEREGLAAYPSIRQGSGLFYSSHGLVATAAGKLVGTDAEGQHHEASIEPQRNLAQSAHWTLSFPAGWGAPSSVPLHSFGSWTESANPGIRYFSGNATYRTTLKLAAQTAGTTLWLRLNDVREIAEVRINGHAAGTIWRSPNAVRIDQLLHPGENTVEIAVANLWPNRLIGDLQPGATRHYTQSNSHAYKPGSPLLPSGLLEPVVIEAGTELEWNK
jgi:hypothetical protein